MVSRITRQFGPVYEKCRRDIMEWCKLWNFEPTWQQAQVLQAVQDMHRIHPTKRKKKGIAVCSGRGTGKTALSTIVSSWRQIRFEGTRTVVSAPNMRQCNEVFIQEFRERIGKAHPLVPKYLFPDITSKKIRTCNDDHWDILAATASDPQMIAGFHNEHLGYVLEECGGIEREIITTLRGSLTNEDAFIFAIGNGTRRDSAFFDFFYKEPENWVTFFLNSEESPIIAREWVAEMERTYGRESDAYRVHVLGQFPKTDPDAILNSEDILACTKTDQMQMARVRTPDHNYRQFGIDFARYGSDESVIYQRQGNAVIAWERFTKTDPNDVVDKAFLMQYDQLWKDEDVTYVGDAGGMGQGLMGNFTRAGKKLVEFHNNGKSADPKYVNKITEAWFNFRELVRERKVWIPNDNVLLRQLEARKYSVDKKGKFLVESKDEYTKRLEESSPDRADALVMAYYRGGIATGKVLGGSSTHKLGSSI